MHLLSQAVSGAKRGLSSASLRYNYPTLMNWKAVAAKSVGANSKKSFENAGITCLHGFAHFIGPNEISVKRERYTSANFLITTGSSLHNPSIKGLDTVSFSTPSTALDLTRPPKAVFIVGAGSTGCELAQYFIKLGSKVLIADISGRLLRREDEEAGQIIDAIFNKLGVKVLTQSRVTAISRDAASKKVIFMRGGQEKSVRVDEIILATGSKPNIDMGLENAGVQYTKDGIKVDNTLRTNAKNILAAGDVIGGDSSTERAVYEAVLAVSNLIHRTKNEVDYKGFVRITNTYPMIAQVGVTEDDCLRRDRKFKKTLVPVGSSIAGKTSGFQDGFVKLIVDKSNKIIGSTIVSPHADLMVQELSMAIKYGLTAAEAANVPHVASGWGEVVRLAAKRLTN
jgi:dihydrolipoamide dehydrogenase